MENKINNFKHQEKVDNKKLHIISVVSFLMGFASALLSYVVSSYLKEVLGTDNIGVVYIITYLIVLLLLLNLHKVVRVSGKSFVLQLSLILKIISVVGLLLMPMSIVGIWFLVLYIISGIMAWTSLDGILESFSDDRRSGRIRGAHLAIINAGFLMGPLLSSQILEKYGFSGLFVTSLLVYSLIFIIAMINIRKTNHKFKKDINISNLLKKVFRRKNIMKVYYISFTLEFFYALMVIYVPLYLLDKGFSWDQLGMAFTIMLVPFVLIQYPMGIIADKKTGEKEFLLFSFFILGISTLIFYFTHSSNILVWTTILLLGRIGAALVEILRESYFYKRIDGNDVDVIDFFRTAKPVAYIVAASLSTILLVFFSVKSIFLLVSLVAFSAIYPTFKLVDSKTEKDITKEFN